jgi:hypothetical protein
VVCRVLDAVLVLTVAVEVLLFSEVSEVSADTSIKLSMGFYSYLVENIG